MRLASTRLDLLPRSMVASQGMEFGLVQSTVGRKLAVLGPTHKIEIFDGVPEQQGDATLLVCPLTPHNARSLRELLPWLKPHPLGLSTSAGMGDRLGLATPGHVRALRATSGKLLPIFAQQSIREMQRTGRNPQQVIDDATWGVFEEGWRDGMGADADHLKTTEDIDACLSAGYTFYTIDPGAFVNDLTHHEDLSLLNEQIDEFPAYLQPQTTGLLDKSYTIEGFRIKIDEHILVKAIVKYGQAIDQVFKMYQHLQKVAGKQPFEVEVSMDETETPTTPAEHVYIASELRRLGVHWVSFAPRFVGRFEKGVDYIGDLDVFETELDIHAAIARQFGPYKLSLHSGSDKFSIYPIFSEKTNGLSHLKTAGTSYLEALRTIADVDQDLFREIYIFARQHFERDKQSYHISAQIHNAPAPDQIQDWSGLLDQFDAREILHVTFGSVLTEKSSDGTSRFYDRLITLLEQNRQVYFSHLEAHFRRHLHPFSTTGSAR